MHTGSPIQRHAWISSQNQYLDIARELGGWIRDMDVYLLLLEISCRDAIILDERFGENDQFPHSDFLAFNHWQET